MTPTPASGEIWEWLGMEPAHFLLLQYKKSPADEYWQAVNLTAGVVEDITIHEHNIVNWRFLE